MSDYKPCDKCDLGELGRKLFGILLRSTASDGSFDDMLAYCEKKKVKYTDESFPPNKKSLINDWTDESDDIVEKVEEWGEFTWERASEMPEMNDEDGVLAVFQDDVTPSDIKQGLLGDCYFLSILSALAENPDRITKLFLTERTNEFGIYAVLLKKNGEAREVVVDDYFPCQDGEPCFSKANGNELWVLILEKAWAKLHGSYERIEAGFAHNVMTDLTGAPAFDLDIDDEGEDPLWERLHEAEVKNYMMAASAGTTEASAEQMEELGLVAEHSYGLLKVADITDGDGESVRLVLLRNPWGDFEWDGDWGDKSDLWTDDIKRQCGYSDEEGLFWMGYIDFCKYFGRVQVCQINDDYQYSFMKAGHNPGHYCLMHLKTGGDGEHTVSVSQTDERCFNRKSDYDYSNVRVIVMRITRDGENVKDLEVEYMKGCSGWERETHCQFANLPHGEYYVFVEFDWNENTEETEFCVTCYGKSRSFFLRDEHSLFEKEDLLRKVYASKAEKQMEGVTTVNFADRGAPKIQKFKGFNEEGYGFIHFKNDEADAAIKETVNYTSFKGLTMCKPQQGNSYEVNVKPGQSKTILIRCHQDGYGMGCKTTTQIVMGKKQLKETCRQQGKKAGRPDTETGEPRDIYQYSYTHSDGVCYLYVNETKEYTLEEDVEFSLQGLEIEGSPGESTVSFVVKPGQEHFIKLKQIATPWKIGTGISYGVY